MDIKIAIPSHRRPIQIEKKAIKMLLENGYKHNEIEIFVSDQKDADEYAHLNELGCDVIYEKPLNSLQEKYNFMYDYYGLNEKILFVEDDIYELVKKNGYKSDKFTGLKKLAIESFERCEKVDCILWGIGPTDNGFYMKNAITKDLKIIAGYVFGFINTKSNFMRCGISQKHDFERTLSAYIFKNAVIRNNHIGQKSNSFKTKGGIQSQYSKTERLTEELSANKYLLRKFPHLLRRRSRPNKVLNEQSELRILKPKGDIDLMQYQKHIDSNL